MDVKKFLKTGYVGDRGCKSVLVDGWKAEVKVQVTCISRVRSETWNYYADEDLIDGFIVFEGVTQIFFEPPGMVPNDLINEIRVDELASQNQARYQFVLSIDAVDASGERKEVEVRIHADSMALEDQGEPGKRITQ